MIKMVTLVIMMLMMMQTLKKMYMDPDIMVLLACILDDVDEDGDGGKDVDNGDDVADTEEDVHDPETEPGPWHRGVAGMST